MKVSIPGQGEVEINKDDYDFLDKIADSDFAGLIGGDWVKYWRWINLTKIAQKVRKKCEQQGLNPKSVAPKFIHAFFDGASLEGEDDIQELWANLLVNATLSSDIKVSYTAILKEIDPIEARIMQYIYLQYVAKYGLDLPKFRPANEYAGSIDGGIVKQVFTLSNEEFEQAIDNLYRLRLLAPTASRLEFIEDKETPFAHYSKNVLGITYLGYYFIRSCNMPTDTVKEAGYNE